MKPLAESFYHSVSDFEPRILIRGIRDSLTGQECSKDVDRLAGFIDLTIRFMYYIIEAKETMERHSTQCDGTTNYEQIFGSSQCHAIFYLATTNSDICDPCPRVKDVHIDPDPCSIVFPSCICCYAGVLKARESDKGDFLSLIHVYLANNMNPYRDKAANVDKLTQSCVELTVHLQWEFAFGTMFNTIYSNVGLLSNENVTFEQYYGDFLNDTYDKIYSNFTKVKDTVLKVCKHLLIYIN